VSDLRWSVRAREVRTRPTNGVSVLYSEWAEWWPAEIAAAGPSNRDDDVSPPRELDQRTCKEGGAG
jgi:hypothetical protein